MRRDHGKGQAVLSSGKRRGRWVRRMVLGGVFGLVLSGLAVTGLWWATQSTPVFYSSYLQSSESQRAEAAAELDRKLAGLVASAYREAASGELAVFDGPSGLEQQGDELSALVSGVVPAADTRDGLRVDAVRELSLNNAELAALVARHIDEWMEQRGYVRPSGVTRPIVAVVNGRLHLAFTLETERYTQTFSGAMSLGLLPSGMAELSVSELRAGQLPLPVDGVGGYLDGRGGERARQIGEWLETLERVEFRPVLKLEQGVRARLVDFTLRPEGIGLRLRLQDRDTYRRDNYQLAAGATVDELGLLDEGAAGESVLVGVPVE